MIYRNYIFISYSSIVIVLQKVSVSVSYLLRVLLTIDVTWKKDRIFRAEGSLFLFSSFCLLNNYMLQEYCRSLRLLKGTIQPQSLSHSYQRKDLSSFCTNQLFLCSLRLLAFAFLHNRGFLITLLEVERQNNLSNTI